MKIVCEGKTREVSGGTSQEVYSTEETRIGTWIDGKPLYRMSFTGTSGAVKVKTVLVDLSVNDIETVTNLYGSLFRKDAYPAQVSINSQQETWYIGTFYEESDKSVSIIVSHTAFANRKVVGTIEYTKTTDQAAIQLDSPLF